MSERDPLVRLLHMRDFARSAVEIAARGSRELMDQDEVFAYALIYVVSMIGEAGSGVSAEVREAAPELPWTDIIGARDRLIHGYVEVRHDVVWDAATVDVPDLLPKLEALIERLRGPAEPCP